MAGSGTPEKTIDNKPLEPATIPKRLVASIGGFVGASYKVELAPDGTVTYLRNPRTFINEAGTRRTRIRVPRERWLAFRHQLDAARVWSWRPEYLNRSIADGTVWHLEIAYPDRSIKSHGSNAYPPQEQFEQFRVAVQDLIGGKAFQ